MTNKKTCHPCNLNCDQGRTDPAHFEPCNDACAAGASCPPGGVCDRKHKASEMTLIATLRRTTEALTQTTKERDALKTLVTAVHKAKGRYHSQLAMCALYDACGLPNVKPVSGERS